MSYYRDSANVYSLLLKVVNNVQRIHLVDVPVTEIKPYSRMHESDYVISEDMLRSNKSVVTAHILSEYRPNHLRMENLMVDSEETIIDTILRETGGFSNV